ncbi:hypothetical protein [Cupriavidus necator]
MSNLRYRLDGQRFESGLDPVFLELPTMEVSCDSFPVKVPSCSQVRKGNIVAPEREFPACAPFSAGEVCAIVCSLDVDPLQSVGIPVPNVERAPVCNGALDVLYARVSAECIPSYAASVIPFGMVSREFVLGGKEARHAANVAISAPRIEAHLDRCYARLHSKSKPVPDALNGGLQIVPGADIIPPHQEDVGDSAWAPTEGHSICRLCGAFDDVPARLLHGLDNNVTPVNLGAEGKVGKWHSAEWDSQSVLTHYRQAPLHQILSLQKISTGNKHDPTGN